MFCVFWPSIPPPQSFPEALVYNEKTGQFEVVSEAGELACSRIRSAISACKSQFLTHGSRVLTKSPRLDTHYVVCVRHLFIWKRREFAVGDADLSFRLDLDNAGLPLQCLDREQGIQWIIKERLPLFLQSNCYYEYRYSTLECMDWILPPGFWLADFQRYFLWHRWVCFAAVCFLKHLTTRLSTARHTSAVNLTAALCVLLLVTLSSLFFSFQTGQVAVSAGHKRQCPEEKVPLMSHTREHTRKPAR